MQKKKKKSWAQTCVGNVCEPYVQKAPDVETG